jgi:hypothetical protein
MTPITLPPTPSRATRSRGSRGARPLARAPRPLASDPHGESPRGGSSTQGAIGSGGPLGRYTDPAGRPRELVTRPGHAGTVLVIDRDATTLGDRRLLAHLAADEPAENANLVCRCYLDDPRSPRCRAVIAEDLHTVPFAGRRERPEPGSTPTHLASYYPAHLYSDDPAQLDSSDLTWRDASDLIQGSSVRELCDREGRRHRLEAQNVDMRIPELRWRQYPPRGAGGEPRTESVRDVVACLESYEPVCALTAIALDRHRKDPHLSVAVLGAELGRIDASRIVLNRGLRRAVQRAIRTQGLTLSEIALRCGRIKRDAKGNASGETSWLARRVGIAPESGGGVPTPWIHSEVLALIARNGLGICPREVEL